MIYVTGDTHGKFDKIENFIKKNKLSSQDMVVVCGDSGINYTLDKSDKKLKKRLSKLNVTFFLIHGNHEEYPECISSYKMKNMFSGTIYYEDEYPNLIFAKDGCQYEIDGKKILVIGGAYSIDKEYRIKMNIIGFKSYKWFSSEQIDERRKKEIMNDIKINNNFDFVMTHTCPKKYEPTEVFLPFINQDLVDFSTEEFLNIVEEKIIYKKWFCGHFHINKETDKIRFLFDDIIRLENFYE